MTLRARRGACLHLHAHTLAGLPIVNHFAGRLGLADALERHVPATDARLRLAPAVALGVLIRA